MTMTSTDVLDVRAKAHRARRRRRVLYVVYLTLGMLMFLAVWEWLASPVSPFLFLMDDPQTFMPRPISTISHFIQNLFFSEGLRSRYITQACPPVCQRAHSRHPRHLLWVHSPPGRDDPQHSDRRGPRDDLRPVHGIGQPGVSQDRPGGDPGGFLLRDGPHFHSRPFLCDLVRDRDSSPDHGGVDHFLHHPADVLLQPPGGGEHPGGNRRVGADHGRIAPVDFPLDLFARHRAGNCRRLSDRPGRRLGDWAPWWRCSALRREEAF